MRSPSVTAGAVSHATSLPPASAFECDGHAATSSASEHHGGPALERCSRDHPRPCRRRVAGEGQLDLRREDAHAHAGLDPQCGIRDDEGGLREAELPGDARSRVARSAASRTRPACCPHAASPKTSTMWTGAPSASARASTRSAASRSAEESERRRTRRCSSTRNPHAASISSSRMPPEARDVGPGHVGAGCEREDARRAAPPRRSDPGPETRVGRVARPQEEQARAPRAYRPARAARNPRDRAAEQSASACRSAAPPGTVGSAPVTRRAPPPRLLRVLREPVEQRRRTPWEGFGAADRHHVHGRGDAAVVEAFAVELVPALLEHATRRRALLSRALASP